MSILCSLFGHQPPVYARKGWYSPGEEYGKVILGPVDGIGRKHAQVEAECARCQTKFIVARIHLPTEKKAETK